MLSSGQDVILESIRQVDKDGGEAPDANDEGPKLGVVGVLARLHESVTIDDVDLQRDD